MADQKDNSGEPRIREVLDGEGGAENAGEVALDALRELDRQRAEVQQEQRPVVPVDPELAARAREMINGHLRNLQLVQQMVNNHVDALRDEAARENERNEESSGIDTDTEDSGSDDEPEVPEPPNHHIARRLEMFQRPGGPNLEELQLMEDELHAMMARARFANMPNFNQDPDIDPIE